MTGERPTKVQRLRDVVAKLRAILPSPEIWKWSAERQAFILVQPEIAPFADWADELERLAWQWETGGLEAEEAMEAKPEGYTDQEWAEYRAKRTGRDWLA